jgi:hypothetical protein
MTPRKHAGQRIRSAKIDREGAQYRAIVELDTGSLGGAVGGDPWVTLDRAMALALAYEAGR